MSPRTTEPQRVSALVTMILPVLFLVLCPAVQAGLISGDFRTESNLPDVRNGLPLVYQDLGAAIGPGYELDDNDFLENPDNWGGGVVWMDYDPSTDILTLDSQDDWDFKTFDAWISNIVFDTPGEFISGINLLTNDLTSPLVTPSLSFTADSLHISYDNMPNVFYFTTRTATFQIETTTVVPEPGSLIIGLGLLGGLLARRWKRGR